MRSLAKEIKDELFEGEYWKSDGEKYMKSVITTLKEHSDLNDEELFDLIASIVGIAQSELGS